MRGYTGETAGGVGEGSNSMKLTKKQNDEIDFLCRYFGGDRSDVEDYILATTRGLRSVSDKFSVNPLRNAKTSLDRNIKMWRAGLREGTLFPSELRDSFGDHPYGAKVVKAVVSSVR